MIDIEKDTALEMHVNTTGDKSPGVLLTSPGSKFRLVQISRAESAERQLRVLGCDFDPLAGTRELFDTFIRIEAQYGPGV